GRVRNGCCDRMIDVGLVGGTVAADDDAGAGGVKRLAGKCLSQIPLTTGLAKPGARERRTLLRCRAAAADLPALQNLLSPADILRQRPVGVGLVDVVAPVLGRSGLGRRRGAVLRPPRR